MLLSVICLQSNYEIDAHLSIFLGMVLIPGWFIVLLCAFSRRLRLPSILILLLGCCLFLQWRAVQIDRLTRLKHEIPQVVAYIEQFKTDHGDYPHDLSGYKFLHPDLREYVNYVSHQSPGSEWAPYGAYHIKYHPTHAEGIGHWYSPPTGYWYEDD